MRFIVRFFLASFGYAASNGFATPPSCKFAVSKIDAPPVENLRNIAATLSVYARSRAFSGVSQINVERVLLKSPANTSNAMRNAISRKNRSDSEQSLGASRFLPSNSGTKYEKGLNRSREGVITKRHFAPRKL